MKLDVVSDLHFEFLRESGFTRYCLPENPSDILLIAGDVVASFGRLSRLSPNLRDVWERFWEELVGAYSKVYLVLGNHDYWYSDFGRANEAVKLFCEDEKVKVLNNETVPLQDDLCLFGATFWTHITDPRLKMLVQFQMNDYNYIKVDDRFLTVDDVVTENEKSFAKLLSEVKVNGDKRFVVLSHHAPSLRSHNVERYGDSKIKFAYCNEYDDVLEEHPNVVAWIHGHDHEFHDYRIGNCHVFANPFGYHQGWDDEAKEFKIKTIEV